MQFVTRKPDRSIATIPCPKVIAVQLIKPAELNSKQESSLTPSQASLSPSSAFMA